MVIACRRGHPLGNTTPLGKLADARWLGFNAPESGSWIEQMFAAADIASPCFTMCQSFAFAFELMARSDSLMPVPATCICRTTQPRPAGGNPAEGTGPALLSACAPAQT
jgi:hypothetical protein